MSKQLVSILVLAALATANTKFMGEAPTPTPQKPVWPAKFTATQVENGGTDKEMKGEWLYDATRPASWMSRTPGKYDGICNGDDTECVQVVYEEVRYNYFPAHNTCCQCCTAEQGCGIIGQDWVDNVSYNGIVTKDNQQVFQWNVTDGHPNYLWETTQTNPADRTWVGYTDGAASYILSDFVETVDDSKIYLPDACNKSNLELCPSPSVCAAIRGL